MSAADAWKLLRKRTQHNGIIAKLNSMRTVLRTKFSHATSTIVTLGELENLLACIYEGGTAPTHDEWSIVLMLNALENTDYNPLRGHLVSRFTSDHTTPTRKEVHDAITFAGYEHAAKTSEQIHVAKASCDSSSK